MELIDGGTFLMELVKALDIPAEVIEEVTEELLCFLESGKCGGA